MEIVIPVTVIVAVAAVILVRPSSVVIAPSGIVFVYKPGVKDVTLTSMLQDAFAASTLRAVFVKVMTLVPATAVIVPPGQLSVGAVAGGYAAITNPEAVYL